MVGFYHGEQQHNGEINNAMRMAQIGSERERARANLQLLCQFVWPFFKHEIRGNPLHLGDGSMPICCAKYSCFIPVYMSNGLQGDVVETNKQRLQNKEKQRHDQVHEALHAHRPTVRPGYAAVRRCATAGTRRPPPNSSHTVIALGARSELARSEAMGSKAVAGHVRTNVGSFRYYQTDTEGLTDVLGDGLLEARHTDSRDQIPTVVQTGDVYACRRRE